MKHIRYAAFFSATLCLLASWILFGPLNPAGAAVFERDWKTPGDGLLTYDDVNRREWLDLTESVVSQFPGVNLEVQILNALAQRGSGGVFEGFQLGRYSDVQKLAESAGIDSSTLSYSLNGPATTQLIELLGMTHNGSSPTSWGYFSQPTTREGPGSSLKLFSSPIQQAGLITTANFDASIALWLYRQIPEPTSLTSGSVGIVLMGLRRRRRQAARTLKLHIDRRLRSFQGLPPTGY